MQLEIGDLVELHNYRGFIGIITEMLHRYEGVSYLVYWFDTEEVSCLFSEDLFKVGMPV